MKSTYDSFKIYFALPLGIAILSFLSFSDYINYKTTSVASDDEILKKLEDPQSGKVYVIHYGDEVWRLNYPVLNENKISGEILPVTEEHKQSGYQINKDKIPTFKNAKISEREVHIYLKEADYDFVTGKTVDISLNEIREIKFYNKISNTFFTVLTASAGTAAVMGMIVDATKSSCPFAYTFNGKDYNLEGEIFSGAIFKPMERGDFLKLKYLFPHEGMYKVVISNELKEVQYINQLELMVANAQKGAKVLLDQDGKPHSIMQKSYCISCTDINKKDVSYKVYKSDDQTYLFDNLEHNVNQLNMEFDRPLEADNVKLVLKARSSFWVDYLWGEYSRFYGKDFDTFVKERNNAPKEMLLNWKKQAGLPLTISILVDGKWKVVEELEHTGPIAFRELVVPIDLKEISGDRINLRLTTGYQFWEIDYAYADFSPDVSINISYIDPVAAVDQMDRDLREAVVCNDEQYVIQPTTDDELHLLFEQLNPGTGTENSYFLYAKGYYNHIRDFSMVPDPSDIPENFMDPIFLMEFSRSKYKELSTGDNTQ